jgi:surfactin synthase thioesterase subunit
MVQPTINVFCIPFAGGSKYSYVSFSKLASKNLHFILLELPGRGARTNEPLLADIHTLADDVFHQIKKI